MNWKEAGPSFVADGKAGTYRILPNPKGGYQLDHFLEGRALKPPENLGNKFSTVAKAQEAAAAKENQS